MTISNRSDYIKYRFHRAEEAYEEAIILAEKERWNASLNRLYYSCFYAVIALLLKNNIETQTHDGARTQFGLNFIKSNRIDKKYGKLFTKLFDLRQKGDYGDLFDFDKKIVEPLINQVKEFNEEIKKLID
ncbi:MAG: HEPN domain-containing protein [Nitrosopumilales archaeon]|nr:MAG: HEPN domain-containing protein [Nitrosopumilales archaeon]